MSYPPTGPDDQGPGPVPPPPGGQQPGPVPPPPSGPAQPLVVEEPAIVPRRRRGLVAAVLAATVLLVVPGAVFAYRALDGGGTQPHDVLPADAVGYVRIDLDPSAGQKVDAFRFLRNFPLFTEATGITDENTDLRERLVDAFAADTGCDIDFGRDVEPWIGDRLGAAFTSPADGDGEPGMVLALQAGDEDAALAAMDTVLGCSGDEDGVGSAYVDGYLLITDTQQNADGYAESAGDRSLADNPDFVEAMDRLGEPGIASLWFSGTAMFDAFAGSAESFGLDTDAQGFGTDEPGFDSELGFGAEGPGLPSLDEARELVDETYRSIAVSFRFDDRYAEIAGVITGSAYQALDGGGVAADVPEDTTLFIGAGNAGSYLTDNWDTAVESYPDYQEDLAALEDETGLRLPDDLATVLGENLVVAVDANDLDLDAIMQYGDFSTLQAGLRVVTDPEAFTDLWDRIQDLASDSGQPLDQLPLEITDDGYILATGDDYVAELREGGRLGDSDVYRTAVGGDDADSVFFFNFDAIEEHVLSAAGGLSDAEIETIEAIQAIGMAAHLRDGHMELSLRLTTD